MSYTEKISVDFEVIKTDNPKILAICDTSIWGVIVDKPAIIEITTPMAEKPQIDYLDKKSINVFNTSNLKLSPLGQYNYLPDGVYKIVIKGSPDTFNKTRYYLKTDALQLKIDEMHIDYGFFNDVGKKELFQYYITLKAAESVTRLGRIEEGLKYYNQVRENVEAVLECKDCN